jgi:outer membrane lipoprotein-sorting protein
MAGFMLSIRQRPMKKTIIYTLLFLGTLANAFAQKDTQAKVILDQLSKKYHSYNMVKSDFTFIIEDQQNNAQQTQEGTLIVQARTNKYKLSLYGTDSKDIEQEIISDGKSQWTYLKKDKEVQLTNVDHSDGGFNPAQLFTMYDKGYKYIYTGNKNIDGRVYQIVDLTPEDIKKSFFKIRLTIDKVKKQIYNALIFDNNGNKYNYTLRSFTPNVQMPESIFTFDKKAHPGVELVDLR